MPTKTNRKSKKVKEDYYKTLQVRKNARPEKIRNSYIQLVKQFPPETHPEEFQAIRRAYDTLRDPAKRAQYDIFREYATDDVNELMQRAVRMHNEGKKDQAVKVLTAVTESAPQYWDAHRMLGQIAVKNNDLAGLEAVLARALKAAKTDDDHLIVNLMKVNLLSYGGMMEDALTEIDKLVDRFPKWAYELREAKVNVYIDRGLFQDALKAAASGIPARGFDDLGLVQEFVLWGRTIVDTERWQDWSKVKASMRQFAQSIKKEEDRKFVLNVLGEEIDEWEYNGEYRPALAFLELSLMVAPKDLQLLDRRRHLEHTQRLDKEMSRLRFDESMYLWVILKAIEFFNDANDLGFDMDRDMGVFDGRSAREMLEMMAIDHEAIALSLVRLKKKYAMIYREYQSDWEELLTKYTEGLNREQRRSLR